MLYLLPIDNSLYEIWHQGHISVTVCIVFRRPKHDNHGRKLPPWRYKKDPQIRESFPSASWARQLIWCKWCACLLRVTEHFLSSVLVKTEPCLRMYCFPDLFFFEVCFFQMNLLQSPYPPPTKALCFEDWRLTFEFAVLLFFILKNFVSCWLRMERKHFDHCIFEWGPCCHV